MGVVAALLVVAAASCRPAVTNSPDPEASALGSGPLWEQLQWVLTNLADGFRSVDDAELVRHFDEAFLKQVPVAQFRQVTAQVAASGPYTLEKFERPPTATSGVAIVVARTGAKSRLSIAVETPNPHRITSLLIQPAPDLSAPAAKTWKEFDEKLASLASKVGFLAAEIKSENLVPIHQVSPDRRLALGSAFKLYILGALAQQVEEGKTNWTDELAIKNELKSLPSGDMRNERAGAKFSVRHFAEQMISVSDNTATDHLLFHAGSDNRWFVMTVGLNDEEKSIDLHEPVNLMLAAARFISKDSSGG
jgi:beta-lactamase family protein/uncharacterized protein